VQAVVLDRLIGETSDTSPLSSAKISPLTNIPTSLNERDVLKIVPPPPPPPSPIMLKEEKNKQTYYTHKK